MNTLERTMPKYLLSRVLRVFYESLLEIHFEYNLVSVPHFRTRHEFYIAFLMLFRRGFSFTNEKVSEVLSCSAFTIDENEQIDSELLDELRRRDRDGWEKCIVSLIERDLESSPKSIFDYLIERKDPFFLGQTRQKLISTPLNSHSMSYLLDYFLLFDQEDSDETLWGAYVFQRLVGLERHKYGAFRPLFLLLEKDDEFAWIEVKRLIELGMDLSEELKHAGSQITLSKNPSRLPILSKWLVVARRNHSGNIWWDSVPARLQHIIATIGGEEAISELTHIKEMRLFPDSDWLGACRRNGI